MEDEIPCIQVQFITVTGKRKPLQTEYKLHRYILSRVTSAKYLGVTIYTENLRWDSHINDICAKANRTLGFLKRNIKIGSVAIKQQAYFTLVRPLVEYTSTVWDPHTDRNIRKLEMVQRRAAQYVTNRHSNKSSVSDMLQGLDWQTLEDRQRDARLCMLYRVDRRLVAIKIDRRLISPIRKTRSRFQTIRCNTDKEGCHFSQGQFGTGMPCLQTYKIWVHSVPSRPVCHQCKASGRNCF